MAELARRQTLIGLLPELPLSSPPPHPQHSGISRRQLGGDCLRKTFKFDNHPHDWHVFSISALIRRHRLLQIPIDPLYLLLPARIVSRLDCSPGPSHHTYSPNAASLQSFPSVLRISISPQIRTRTVPHPAWPSTVSRTAFPLFSPSNLTLPPSLTQSECTHVIPAQPPNPAAVLRAVAVQTHPGIEQWPLDLHASSGLFPPPQSYTFPPFQPKKTNTLVINWPSSIPQQSTHPVYPPPIGSRSQPQPANQPSQDIVISPSGPQTIR
ncbi:hypothetical protein PtA15_3A670 [Puccinia triticina]|uniref:Uncharacterized protein n=1 Tax=Puccinia triticina TaxID=208348 RepID=A0ABY7CDK4_9BASI|nr:uncharacterized protein PtA15_3A670 [Puccinia triticina]WAQ83301.1 hypothetical protein PtA15_3A670 [Puccinia triticina]WAR54151.1 hypothetical protein PtB15_3B663 [Puccinia triticina]